MFCLFVLQCQGHFQTLEQACCFCVSCHPNKNFRISLSLTQHLTILSCQIDNQRYNISVHTQQHSNLLPLPIENTYICKCSCASHWQARFSNPYAVAKWIQDESISFSTPSDIIFSLKLMQYPLWCSYVMAMAHRWLFPYACLYLLVNNKYQGAKKLKNNWIWAITFNYHANDLVRGKLSCRMQLGFA